MSESLQPAQLKWNNDCRKNVRSSAAWCFQLTAERVLQKQMFLAEIELELRVFKYTWRRGLRERDPVRDGEQLWAVSCVGAFDCSVQGFHQLLPLSLRRSPSPLRSQLHFTRCNKAFMLFLSPLLRLFCRTTTLQSKCRSLLLCQCACAALWCALMLF